MHRPPLRSTLFPYTTLFRSLKVLLAPRIPESYLSAPRGQYQGASQLAAAAGVSVMSGFRFIEEFSKEGFLRSEEHTSELQSPMYLVCRLLLEKKNDFSPRYC